MLYVEGFTHDGFMKHAHYKPAESLTLDGMMDHLEERPWDRLMNIHLGDLAMKDPANMAHVRERFNRRPHITTVVYTEDWAEDPSWQNVLLNEHPSFEIRSAVDEDFIDYRIMGLAIRELNKYLTTGEPFDPRVIRRAIDLCPQLAATEIIKNYVPLSAPESNAGTSFSTGTSLRDVDVRDTFDRIRGFFDGLPEVYPARGTYSSSYGQGFHLRAPFDIPIEIKGTLKTGGKGTNEMASRVSAMMEYIERVSATVGTEDWPNRYKGDVDVRRARLSDLEKDGLNVLDPNSLNLPCNYRNEEIYWVSGTTFDGERIYAPAEIVFMNLFLDAPAIAQVDSTGLASGNTLEEAKLHGLLEVVERDAKESNTPYRNLTVLRKGNNPEAVDRCIDFYGQDGIKVIIQENTSEFGIPCYVACANIMDQAYGAGTHLNSELAIVRAIGELNMGLNGSRHTLRRRLEVDLPERDLSEFPNLSSGDFRTDLELTESTLSRNGFQPIYFDLTHADFDIPVVRAIVPGLHNWGPDAKYQRNYRHFLEKLSEMSG